MSTMAPDGSTSIPDSSAPDASQPDGSGSTSSDSSQPPVDEPQAQASLSLNRSDFTLFKAGATFQMKAKADPAGGALAWKSSDESVATVSDKGLVTAVAVGNATITVTDSETGLTASCIVRCNWEEQKPERVAPQMAAIPPAAAPPAILPPLPATWTYPPLLAISWASMSLVCSNS